ncbi:MAG: hypothetical protein U9M94_04365 [Patescibacteria group bacterium]|nr:hypothetical protein [Patescibacteria group bacterium]
MILLKKQIRKLLIFIIVFAIFVAAAGFFIFKLNKDVSIVMAGTGHNVSGFAWNSNIGWISFNTIDCDTNGNSAYDAGDAGPAGCPAVGAPFFDYGVNVNSITKNLSGYAWSSNVGWISFQENNTPNNAAVTANCDASCNPMVDCTSCYKPADSKIYGWAKILSMGDDGWIRFDHGRTGFEATGDVANSGLNGWAYNEGNNNVGIGWISFSCNNALADCTVSDYQTTAELNQLPRADNLKTPNWWPVQACDTALVAYLKWEYNDGDDPFPGDKMSAYRLIIKNETDSIEVLDTGKCIKVYDGDNSCCAVGDANCTDNPSDCQIDILGMMYGTGNVISYELDSTVLDYGKKYSWSVEVWDSYDGGSGATFYNSAADTPVSVDDGNPLTFTTFVSEFPNPDNFIWSPNSFSAEEDVLFESMDRAKYYVGGVEHDCDESKCLWDWIDVDNNIEPFVDASSTIMIFTAYGIPSKVKLKVTDINTSYSCSSTTEAFIIKQKLPSWIEAK